PVGLVDDKNIADFEDSGLDGLNVVTESGDHHDTGRVRFPDDIHFVLTDADRFNNNNVHPEGVHDQGNIRGRARKTSQCATRGQAANENTFVAGVAVHADTVTQDRAAGKGAGGVDRHYPDLFPAYTKRGGQLIDQRRFSGAGRAGNADDIGVAGAGIECFQLFNRLGAAVVDVAHQAGCGADITFYNLLCKGHGVPDIWEVGTFNV